MSECCPSCHDTGWAEYHEEGVMLGFAWSATDLKRCLCRVPEIPGDDITRELDELLMRRHAQ